MEPTIQEFFHDFRQELMAGAEANKSFQLSEFVEAVANELTDTGFIEGFEFCHFRAQRGLRVDGYWFNDEGSLDLFIADFDCREELLSLTKTEVDSAFKRVSNFFEASKEKNLYLDLEDTAPEYGLARQIKERGRLIRKVNFYLLSERALSGRLQALEDNEIAEVPASYHIWDISRLQRQYSSRGHKEALDINFPDDFGTNISCLPAHLGSETYQSYLIVIPATVLSSLYEKYGARLLEQNVRCFLQARGNVNKGIRNTILNEPQMFFAYNNGITATAQEVETRKTEAGLELVSIKDLQIVNGGQTTASLFHTNRKDKASLEGIFVQMKLSVIDSDESESVVPRISEYANTQNKVNAADFFSNHPFHIRMEEFSRRIWAPAQQGAQRETKWFYERARGQYADAQSKFTPGEKKKFQAEHPKPQMFAKTDLAKFENVWDENPRYVNLGAQKNFAQYAKRIGKEWEKTAEGFNELYFKRVVSRAILFRKTEKLVSAQPWYNGGYRANVVAYTLALLGLYCSQKDKALNFMKIWDLQSISYEVEIAIEITAKLVHDDITAPPDGISNVTEWCKKEGCWLRIKEKVIELDKILPDAFKVSLVDKDLILEEKKSAKKVQKIDDGIEAQRKVMEITGPKWRSLLEQCDQRGVLTPKEAGILQIAAQIPRKIPSEKQCAVLVEVLEKAEQEGIVVNS
ncbi:MAG: AIPR family protein [SAR86 cluster bacterium]|uniref:AIPR family protein n=1 Tax=SAR86 cluster bacterium TaxID=2030880 RepID=A0A2A5ATN2_9GAMM|nr:MAG: AIPR family protein [SAR86 cluster bacterium]